MTDWDKMPVAQKSSLIRMFVENGITDVNQMRHIYAEGGVMDESDTQDVMQEPQQDTLPGDYDQWMNSMALKLSEMSNNSYIFTLCDIADNRDFDYSGMYNDNPQYAWSLLDDGNPDLYELGRMIYGEPEPVMEEIGQMSDIEGDITQNEYTDGGDSSENEYAKGGKIHIKKENRGKFTAAAKRAGKSVQEYARQILANKENYSPTLVKRANFARNASKWHDDGGFLNPDDPPKGKNLIANPDSVWKNMSSAQNGFARSFIGSLKPAPIPAKSELKYKAVTGRDDFKESVLPVMKGDYIKTSQVFDNQLKQDGKDFDLEDFYLNAVETAYPNATKAVNADKDYVKRAVDAEHIIPMDYSKTITLSNAGNLTNAKVPTSLIDAVVENANKRSYDPYIMLGIMGRETTFGQFDPYQSVHPKEANYMVNRANNRSVTDLSNNHNYYVSPIRGEINQTYKNRNIDIPDYYVYGSPLLAQDTYNNINSWIGIGDDKVDFDTRNMRNLVEKTNNTTIKDDWESMMDSYYSKIYTNMNLINETVENLRNSPELQEYIESLSKKSVKQ